MLEDIELNVRSNFKNLAEQAYDKIEDAVRLKNNWRGFEGSITKRRGDKYIRGANRGQGRVVRGAYRNIVDTGELANSQNLDTNDNDGVVSYEISFSAPHYNYVRFGTRNMPGRDFVGLGYSRIKDIEDIDSIILSE